MFQVFNFYDHPSRLDVRVFRFAVKEQAEMFEEELIKANIPYEKEIHEGESFFGVRRSVFEQVKIINYIVIGRFRQPFLANIYLRYIVLAISFISISVALYAYFKVQG